MDRLRGALLRFLAEPGQPLDDVRQVYQDTITLLGDLGYERFYNSDGNDVIGLRQYWHPPVDIANREDYFRAPCGYINPARLETAAHYAVKLPLVGLVEGENILAELGAQVTRVAAFGEQHDLVCPPEILNGLMVVLGTDRLPELRVAVTNRVEPRWLQDAFAFGYDFEAAMAATGLPKSTFYRYGGLKG